MGIVYADGTAACICDNKVLSSVNRESCPDGNTHWAGKRPSDKVQPLAGIGYLHVDIHVIPLSLEHCQVMGILQDWVLSL